MEVNGLFGGKEEEEDGDGSGVVVVVVGEMKEEMEEEEVVEFVVKMKEKWRRSGWPKEGAPWLLCLLF